jgi:hypothetical protein
MKDQDSVQFGTKNRISSDQLFLQEITRTSKSKRISNNSSPSSNKMRQITANPKDKRMLTVNSAN